MIIVPRPKDYKPKGLDGFKYEDMLPLLKRADEIRARKRLEEAAARENEAVEVAQSGSHPASNGGTRTPIATPAPLTKP